MVMKAPNTSAVPPLLDLVREGDAAAWLKSVTGATGDKTKATFLKNAPPIGFFSTTAASQDPYE